MYFIWKSKLFTSSVAISSLLGMIQARISSVLRLASPFLSNSESNLEGFTSQRVFCWRTNKPFLLRDQPFFVLALTSVPNILLETQLAIFISVFLLQDLSNGTNLLCAPLIKTKRKVTKQSYETNLSQNMRSHGRILFRVREGEELFYIKTSVSTDICSHEEEPEIRFLLTFFPKKFLSYLSSSISFHSSAISGSSRSISSSPKSYSSALYSAQVTMPSMFSSASSNLSFESSSLNDLNHYHRICYRLSFEKIYLKDLRIQA